MQPKKNKKNGREGNRSSRWHRVPRCWITVRRHPANERLRARVCVCGSPSLYPACRSSAGSPSRTSPAASRCWLITRPAGGRAGPAGPRRDGRRSAAFTQFGLIQMCSLIRRWLTAIIRRLQYKKERMGKKPVVDGEFSSGSPLMEKRSCDWYFSLDKV